MATVELAITGMTCRACEVRVAKALRAVPGVERARASCARGQAVVTTADPVDRALLDAAVRAAGYEPVVTARPWLSRDRAVWRDVGLAAAGVAVLALLARATGLEDTVAGAGGLAAQGGLAVVVLLGLAAGVSTCMALVGGLVLAVAARFAEQHADLPARQRLRPHLAFNAGRVVGFGGLGAATGALGATVTLDGRAVAVLMLLAAVVMGWVGLRLTCAVPRLAAGGPALPAGLSRALGLDRTVGPYRDRTAALLGAGSYFLPCGFTQAVQVYALSTGSPARAGAVMALFALGTAPGLLGVGGATAVVRGDVGTRFTRVAGVVVVAFATVNASGALGVLAPGLGRASAPGATTVSANVTLDGDIQVLRTTQVATGYEPADAAVYVGREVRWVIDSQALGCATSLSSADLGVRRMLDLGENVLTFTPTEVGVIHYTCLMGMYGGAIEVIADPEA